VLQDGEPYGAIVDQYYADHNNARIGSRISVLDHEFTIARGGQTVAYISKRWLTMTSSYTVDVAPGEDNVLILASVLALDLAIDADHQ